MANNIDELRENNSLRIEKRISILRKYGNTFEQIAEKLNKELKSKYNSGQIKSLYEKHVARANVITDSMNNLKKEATAVRRGWEKEINEMVELLNNRIKEYLSMCDTFLKEAFDSGNRKAFFNDLPAFNKLLKSLQDQIRLLRETQEKIQLNQQNLILNKTQILQVVNKAIEQKEQDTGFEIHPGTGVLTPIKNFKKKKKIVV